MSPKTLGRALPTRTGLGSQADAWSPPVVEDHVDHAHWTETDAFELLAGVSHELGTPLTVIKANTESIRQFLEEHRGWPPELMQRADDVRLAIEQILALRGDLMAASRHELCQMETSPVHFDRVLQRLIRGQRAAALHKGITLTEEYTAEFPYAMSDDWAVESILANLLTNAIRYTPTGGSIRIRTYNTGAYVVAGFEDSGIGISPEEQSLIFQRFYRTQEAKKAEPLGTGLGLALVQELVHASGGSISVTSQPGVGSTFTVALPVAEFADSEA